MKKLFAFVLGSLVVLALSLPVMGPDHLAIQRHHDHTGSRGSSDAEHHYHDDAGSGISPAGRNHSGHRYDYYTTRTAGEADRYDDDHNHASAAIVQGAIALDIFDASHEGITPV